MTRKNVTLLMVDDNDVDCKTPSGLTGMNIGSLNFIPKDLERYDIIVYQGSRGTKVLKSKYWTV